MDHEIWQFPTPNTTSFGDYSANRMNLDINNVGIDMMNRDHDPLLADYRNSNGPFTFKKRRDNGKGVSTSSNANAENENDSKRMKMVGGNENEEGERNSGKVAEEPAKLPEPQKQDYIHVRARRGQATDSHSLAERARREKISERMKVLQDLVPGCNKVIGKALVLDEIINYVQSLQHQVEFLSMKLEAVNSRAAPNIEGFPLKDFGQQAFDTSGLAFSTQDTSDFRGTSPEWLHMQLGGGFERTT